MAIGLTMCWKQAHRGANFPKFWRDIIFCLKFYTKQTVKQHGDEGKKKNLFRNAKSKFFFRFCFSRMYCAMYLIKIGKWERGRPRHGSHSRSQEWWWRKTPVWSQCVWWRGSSVPVGQGTRMLTDAFHHHTLFLPEKVLEFYYLKWE